MKKTELNAIFLGLLSLSVVACGDAGGALEEDPAFDENGNVIGVEDEVDQDDFVDEEPNDEEPNEDEEEEIIEPACGDGFLDPEEQCDDGNGHDGDGCSSDCRIEAFEAEGDIAINLVIDSLVSNDAPAQDSCAGIVALEIDAGEIFGDGRCFLDVNANFLDYVVDADVDADGVVVGEIEIVLNGTAHVLDLEGTLMDGTLLLEFDGVTLVTASIRAVWNGDIAADLD